MPLSQMWFAPVAAEGWNESEGQGCWKRGSVLLPLGSRNPKERAETDLVNFLAVEQEVSLAE
jgi:hypothetical protein